MAQITAPCLKGGNWCVPPLGKTPARIGGGVNLFFEVNHKLQSLPWVSPAIAFDIFSDNYKQPRKKKMAGGTEKSMVCTQYTRRTPPEPPKYLG